MPRAGISVVRIEGIISSKRKGITVANAYMSDGRVIRFGIVARDPLTPALTAQPFVAPLLARRLKSLPSNLSTTGATQ